MRLDPMHDVNRPLMPTAQGKPAGSAAACTMAKCASRA